MKQPFSFELFNTSDKGTSQVWGGHLSQGRFISPASKGTRESQRALLARLLNKRLQFKVINMPFTVGHFGPVCSPETALALQIPHRDTSHTALWSMRDNKKANRHHTLTSLPGGDSPWATCFSPA